MSPYPDPPRTDLRAPGLGKVNAARQLAPRIPAVRLDKDEWVTHLGGDIWATSSRPDSNASCGRSPRTPRPGSERDPGVGPLGSGAERDGSRMGRGRLGAEVELHYLDAPLEELIERADRRTASGEWTASPITRDHFNEWATIFQPPDEDEFLLFDDPRSQGDDVPDGLGSDTRPADRGNGGVTEEAVPVLDPDREIDALDRACQPVVGSLGKPRAGRSRVSVEGQEYRLPLPCAGERIESRIRRNPGRGARGTGVGTLRRVGRGRRRKPARGGGGPAGRRTSPGAHLGGFDRVQPGRGPRDGNAGHTSGHPADHRLLPRTGTARVPGRDSSRLRRRGT